MTLNRPCVRRASAAAASRSCRRCSMDMTCAPSNRRPRLLKTCGMLGVTHSRRFAQLERLADAERACKLAVCLAAYEAQQLAASCRARALARAWNAARVDSRRLQPCTRLSRTSCRDTAYGWHGLKAGGSSSFSSAAITASRRYGHNARNDSEATGHVKTPRLAQWVCPEQSTSSAHRLATTAFERCAVPAATSVDQPARSG